MKSSPGGSVAGSEDDERPGRADPPDSSEGAGEPEGPPRRHSTPADVVAALQEDPRVAKSQKRHVDAPVEAPDTATPSTATRAGALGRDADGEPMTRDDLLGSYGVSDELVADLESFGLIRPVMRGGTSTYDAESQSIVRAAARYQELGVEPRHLRMYKVAAEREAGFVEQLVMPLLKQRNPSSREQAAERTDELLALGAELHASLLRRQIGPILGA